MTTISQNEEANFTEVLRTGRLWEVELIASEFKKQNIPFYQEEQTSSGLRLAKPILPNMAPGVWWVFFVPDRFKEQAKTIISTLPIEVSESPGVWHYNVSGKSNRFFKWFSMALLAIFLIWILAYIFDLGGLFNF